MSNQADRPDYDLYTAVTRVLTMAANTNQRHMLSRAREGAIAWAERTGTVGNVEKFVAWLDARILVGMGR